MRLPQRPVVLLLPWLLAKPAHAAKYAAIYHQRGFDSLTLFTEPRHVLQPRAAREFAARAVSLLTRMPHPFVIHGFSVGGYTSSQILTEVLAAADGALLKSRFVGQVFDSPVDFEGIPRGMATAMATNATAQRVLERSIRQLLHLRKENLLEYQRCSRLLKSNPLRLPTHIFFSDADPVACPATIRAVAENFGATGIAVSTTVWRDTPHVQHMARHPAAYVQALDQFLCTLPGLSVRPVYDRVDPNYGRELSLLK